MSRARTLCSIKTALWRAPTARGRHRSRRCLYVPRWTSTHAPSDAAAAKWHGFAQQRRFTEVHMPDSCFVPMEGQPAGNVRRDGAYGESNWGSPAFRVFSGASRKPRMVIDYRRVNQVTVRATFAMPDSVSVKRASAGKRWYSTGDGVSGFNQIENSLFGSPSGPTPPAAYTPRLLQRSQRQRCSTPGRFARPRTLRIARPSRGFSHASCGLARHARPHALRAASPGLARARLRARFARFAPFAPFARFARFARLACFARFARAGRSRTCAGARTSRRARARDCAREASGLRFARAARARTTARAASRGFAWLRARFTRARLRAHPSPRTSRASRARASRALRALRIARPSRGFSRASRCLARHTRLVRFARFAQPRAALRGLARFARLVLFERFARLRARFARPRAFRVLRALRAKPREAARAQARARAVARATCHAHARIRAASHAKLRACAPDAAHPVAAAPRPSGA